MRERHASSRLSERGSAVIEIPMVLGFLIIPVAFLILTIPTWLQDIHAANDAASEAGRAFVLSGGDGEAVGRAILAAELSHGRDPGSLTLVSTTPTAELSGAVLVEVSVEVQAIALFDLGAFTFTSSHTERYPTYVRTPR